MTCMHNPWHHPISIYYDVSYLTEIHTCKHIIIRYFPFANLILCKTCHILQKVHPPVCSLSSCVPLCLSTVCIFYWYAKSANIYYFLYETQWAQICEPTHSNVINCSLTLVWQVGSGMCFIDRDLVLYWLGRKWTCKQFKQPGNTM